MGAWWNPGMWLWRKSHFWNVNKLIKIPENTNDTISAVNPPSRPLPSELRNIVEPTLLHTRTRADPEDEISSAGDTSDRLDVPTITRPWWRATLTIQNDVWLAVFVLVSYGGFWCCLQLGRPARSLPPVTPHQKLKLSLTNYWSVTHKRTHACKQTTWGQPHGPTWAPRSIRTTHEFQSVAYRK